MNRVIKEEDNVIYVDFENRANLIYYDFQNRHRIDNGPFASFSTQPKTNKQEILFWSSILVLFTTLFFLCLNLLVALVHS